jgi:putative SOS response-associated peptidase YedK
MPVVLDPADHARWLARDCGIDEAAAILGRHLADVAVYKVSAYVNKPEHDDAACLKPLE